jgi:ribose transport system substrate-binding protein
MNPALSISSLPSRILASKTIAILSLALALFELSLPVAKAQKLRIGISMKTLNAPYFAAQGKAAEEEVKKLGATAISSDASCLSDHRLHS